LQVGATISTTNLLEGARQADAGIPLEYHGINICIITPNFHRENEIVLCARTKTSWLFCFVVSTGLLPHEKAYEMAARQS
jgi:hypothetical protein